MLQRNYKQAYKETAPNKDNFKKRVKSETYFTYGVWPLSISPTFQQMAELLWMSHTESALFWIHLQILTNWFPSNALIKFSILAD